MKAILAIAVLLTCISIAGAQKRMIDSLSTELKKHPSPDTVQVQILNLLSYYSSEDDPLKARKFAQLALPIAQELNYGKGIANAYRYMAQSYWNQQDNISTLKFGLLALKEYEKYKIPKGVNACYGLIAASYSQSKDYDKALHYYKLAYSFGKKRSDQEALGGHLNNIAAIFEKTGNYDSALLYYRKASEAWESRGDKFRLPMGFNGIAIAYHNLGDQALALHYLSKALQLSLSSNNKFLSANIYQNIGEVYCKTGEYEESEKYLQHSLRIYKETGNKRGVEELYEAFTRLEKSRENYEAAFYYLQELLQLRDTLYNEERFKQISRLEATYETEKKEQTIRLLEQENRIQSIWQNLLIIGVILVTASAFLFYRLQQSRTQKAKQLLKVQQLLNDKLKEINRLNSRFFTNVSHEFRTPLTLILAPLEEIQKNELLSEEEKEMLLLIKRNANRLLDLVSQLLDLSKLEAGKMALKVMPGNLGLFLKTIASSFDSWAQQKQINFEKDISIGERPLWFDQDKLEKIITNLLANAFKFTPINGTVTFAVSIEDKEGKYFTALTVKDTGRGIPEEEQAHVFSPFYQIKHTQESTQGGTGIGLSLVNELVKIYGGNISLWSYVGIGTTFSVSLPVTKESFTNEQMVDSDMQLSGN